MVSVAVVIAWYASGFLLASWLVDRGHSPVVWWSIASLLGGLTLLPAVVARVSSRRTAPRLDVVARPERPVDGVRLMVVGSTDRLRGALDAVPSVVAGRTGSVTVVGLVGHEAFSTGIDTGERAVAADQVRDAVRPYSRADTRIVTTDGSDRIDAVVGQAGEPDLLVTATRRRTGALRRSVRQFLETSARYDVPVLFVSQGGPRARSARASVQPHVDVVA